MINAFGFSIFYSLNLKPSLSDLCVIGATFSCFLCMLFYVAEAWGRRRALLRCDCSFLLADTVLPSYCSRRGIWLPSKIVDTFLQRIPVEVALWYILRIYVVVLGVIRHHSYPSGWSVLTPWLSLEQSPIWGFPLTWRFVWSFLYARLFWIGRILFPIAILGYIR